MRSKTEYRVIVVLWILFNIVLVVPFIVLGYHWLEIVYIGLTPLMLFFFVFSLLALINKIVNYRNDIQDLKCKRKKERDLKILIYQDLKIDDVPYEIQSAEYNKRRLLHDKKLLIESMKKEMAEYQSTISLYTTKSEHLTKTLKELEVVE